MEMYSTHNKGKSDLLKVIFIRILNNKIDKYMNSISKNVYFDKLDDVINKYNNIQYRTIKMEPDGVKTNTYISSSKEINDEDLLKF